MATTTFGQQDSTMSRDSLLLKYGCGDYIMATWIDTTFAQIDTLVFDSVGTIDLVAPVHPNFLFEYYLQMGYTHSNDSLKARVDSLLIEQRKILMKE